MASAVTRRITLVLSLLLLAVLIAIGYLGVTHARDQARSVQCTNHLKWLGLAFNSYRHEHGALPPAILCDETGKPVNSWRAEIMPYSWYNFRTGNPDIGRAGYDFAEPWNGPNNAKLELDQRWSGEFRCACETNVKPAIASYVAVVGPNTMWPGTKPATPASDGSDDNKVLLIEVINSDILWMEPRDLTIEQALDTFQPKSGMGIGSHHREGIHYLTVGGDVKTLPPNIDRESFRTLLVRDAANVPAE